MKSPVKFSLPASMALITRSPQSLYRRNRVFQAPHMKKVPLSPQPAERQRRPSPVERFRFTPPLALKFLCLLLFIRWSFSLSVENEPHAYARSPSHSPMMRMHTHTHTPPPTHPAPPVWDTVEQENTWWQLSRLCSLEAVSTASSLISAHARPEW